MNITSFANKAITVLCGSVNFARSSRKLSRRDTRAAMPQQKDFALRDSAAFALSCYWARCHEGWSLVLFRDASGVVRHVACQSPDCTYFDARGSCSEGQIAERLGVCVAASYAEEMDVQALLGHNAAVLEAADELRQRVEHKAARRVDATLAV